MAKCSDYIVIDERWLRNRIEEYDKISINAFKQGKPDPDNEGILRDELSDVLANSKPLAPLIEKSFEAGEKHGYEIPSMQMRGLNIAKYSEFLNKEQYLNKEIEI